MVNTQDMYIIIMYKYNVCVYIGVLPIGVEDEDGEGDSDGDVDIVCDVIIDGIDIIVVDVEVVVDGITRKYIKLIIIIVKVILNILPDNVIEAEKFRLPVVTSNKYTPSSAVVRFVNMTL